MTSIDVKNICHFSLLTTIFLFLSACEQPTAISENRTDSTTSENAKEEFVWFNLFLPPETIYKIKPSTLGSNVPFENFQFKDVNQEHNIDIEFTPSAISFYTSKFDSEKEPLWITIETEKGQFFELKIKVFQTSPLDIYSGESDSNPDHFILKGINSNTSTWNNEDIYIGWTHQAKFSPEFSKATLSYNSERYDNPNMEILPLSNALTYISEGNIWTIDKMSFSQLIKNIPAENFQISIYLISEDYSLAEIFEFKLYKSSLQKKVLIPD